MVAGKIGLLKYVLSPVDRERRWSDDTNDGRRVGVSNRGEDRGLDRDSFRPWLRKLLPLSELESRSLLLKDFQARSLMELSEKVL
jgi:hypothetical protein